MRIILSIVGLIAAAGMLGAQTVITSFTATDPMLGSLNILQAEGAVAGSTPGGVASADTRTLYFWTPDLNSNDPGDPPGYTGGNWPYVFVDDSISVGAGLDATLFDTVTITEGDVLTVAGYPVYQFINDSAAGDFSGIGPNWPVVGTDGTAYTQIPEPRTTALALGALALGGVFLRRRRR